MAFRQPQQRPQAIRRASVSQVVAATVAEPANQTAERKRRLEEEPQEWILFSPSLDDEFSTTSRTDLTPRTANLSRLSDLDSLETGIRSDQYAVEEGDESLTCQGTEDDDEGEDLDSLDDGLHAFHRPSSPRLEHSGGTVLPVHDGLGTFASSYPHAANEGMQEHLWQFERYNPHRRRSQRRRSSVQKRLDYVGDEDEIHGLDRHEERRLRIEKWRLEQSRAVLEEIERETRRRQRRMSMASAQSNSARPHPETTTRDTTHATDATDATEEEDGTETESFWQRITRRVIKDLMGLDETTLSVIFGEELVSELDNTPTQTYPRTSSTSPSTATSHSDGTWEQRLLERIARELGLLADRLSKNEGAFSTYKDKSPLSRPQDDAQILPLVPTRSLTSVTTSRPDDVSTNDRLFAPTFPRATIAPAADTSLWGIEEETPPISSSAPLPGTQDPRQDNEYWERDLDVGVIFRYLRNRFSSTSPLSSSTAPAQAGARKVPAGPSTGPLPPAWASDQHASALGTSPESFRRADMIRRHHPLVSHAATVSATRRRESMLLRRQHQFLSHRRAASSSCASQSTKRTRSGGSRRYWDFPSGGGAGSAAGGSAVSVTSGGYEGMMGSWGEV